MQNTYKILSLDGGGIRGLITARLLQRLNDHPKIAGWLDDIDLIAGTSTGGIIALSLAYGKTPEDLCLLYKCKGDNIFNKNLLETIIDVPNIISAEYSNENLKEELYQFFGDKKLADLKTKVAIPTFDLDSEHDFDKTKAGEERGWKPKIFHNFEGTGSDKEFKIKDVALYTSSAPTYFPSADGYIDGGVFANNPSMIAITQAISKHNIKKERAKLKNISLLSVGAGIALQYEEGKNNDWGYSQWAFSLIDILMEGVTGISHFQAEQLLGKKYNRLQIYFSEGNKIKLDDIDKLKEMENLANELDLSETVDWIDKNWC